MSAAHTRWLGAAAAAALAFGCSEQSPDDQAATGGGAIAEPGDAGTGSDAPPAMVCGTPSTFDLPMGPGAIGLATDLAADAAGNVLYAKGGTVTKLDGDGNVKFTRPYGNVVAFDASGNALVAGSFTAALDLGLATGPLVPDGNIDTFIAKLGMDGHVLFARQLHVCGDGLRSIAVATDGRIAISGDAFGTLVLDAEGEVQLAYDFSGALAFDSVGDLVVAGEFTSILDLGPDARFTNAGDGDAFIAKLDATGHVLFTKIIGDPALPFDLYGGLTQATASRQLAAAVAIDASDNIVVLGRFDRAADVLGETYKAFYVSVPDAADDIHSGAFVVRLDAAGDVLARTSISDVALVGDVALDAKGEIFVDGATYTDAAPPFRTTFLMKFDASGQLLAGGGTNTPGMGHSLAVDPCGNLFESVSVRPGSPLIPFEAHLTKSRL